MSPSNLPVTSREYKLMLTNRFHDMKKHRCVFRLLKFLLDKEGGGSSTMRNPKSAASPAILTHRNSPCASGFFAEAAMRPK
jgi:hypothetical protein